MITEWRQAPSWIRRIDSCHPALAPGWASFVHVTTRVTVLERAAAQGFGFIAPDDRSNDAFVHHCNVVGHVFKSAGEPRRTN